MLMLKLPDTVTIYDDEGSFDYGEPIFRANVVCYPPSSAEQVAQACADQPVFTLIYVTSIDNQVDFIIDQSTVSNVYVNAM